MRRRCSKVRVEPGINLGKHENHQSGGWILWSIAAEANKIGEKARRN
jgi:hypothetical protein